MATDLTSSSSRHDQMSLHQYYGKDISQLLSRAISAMHSEAQFAHMTLPLPILFPFENDICIDRFCMKCLISG